MWPRWHLLPSLQRFYTFRTLMFLAIPFFVDTQFTCNEIVKEFRRENQRQDCLCDDRISDFSYYHCQSSNESCFRCLNSSVFISAEAVCDNVVDCPDLTDELLCFEKRKHDPADQCRLSLDYATSQSSQHDLNRYMSFVCGISNSWKFILSCDKDRVNKLSGQQETTTASDFSQQWCAKQFSYCSNIYDENCEGFECYDNTLCDPEDGLLEEDRPLLVIGAVIGTTAILMNTAVIIITINHIYKSHTRLTQEERLTKSFFLSLSISDVLVAVCVTITASALLSHDNAAEVGLQHWIQPCDAVGALSLIGSEQSVFTMVLITLSRIWGIARPFSRMPMKAFLISLLLSWTLSIIIALMPLMNTLEDVFITTIWQKETRFLRYISRNDLDDVTNFLRPYSERDDLSRPKGSWAELRSLLDEIFHLEYYKKGFYQGHHKCLIDLFQTSQSHARVYSLLIFTTNAASFFFMLFGYIYIFMKQQRGRMKHEVPAAEAESEKLKRKIFYILATDFVCWIPVCIYGFLAAGADVIPWSVDQDLYFTATFILLPINSVANPVIYSGAPDYLHHKLFHCFKFRTGQDKRREDITPTLPMTEIDRVSVSMISNYAIDRRSL